MIKYLSSIIAIFTNSQCCALRVMAILALLVPMGCSSEQKDLSSKINIPFPLAITGGQDLGTIWADSTCSRTILLSNISSDEVEVTEFKATCGCTSVEPSSFIIPANQQRNITLNIDLSKSPPATLSDEEVQFGVTLIPRIKNWEGNLPVWKVRGILNKLLVLSPQAVDFDNTLTQGQPFSTKTVKIVCSTPVQSLIAEGGETFATLDIVPVSDTEYVLSIKPNEQLNPGPFRFTVELTAILRSGEEVSMNGAHVYGFVASEIESSPRELRWGAKAVGSTCETRILIRSRLDQPFTIESVTPDSKDTEVNTEESNSNGTVILIKHTTTEPGDQQHSVTVRAKSHEDKTVEINIPIFYHGFLNTKNI